VTAQEQLDSVNEAITVIEAGAQEYRTGGGRFIRRADLAVLYKERRLLAAQAEAEKNGGIGVFKVAIYDRR